MKQRKITDKAELPRKIIISLIRVLTEKFGKPKRVRFHRRPGYTHFCRYTFTWNLSKKNMKDWGKPPHITMSILNNAVFKVGSNNPASQKLYKKNSRIVFFGHTGKAYDTYSEIMNQF